MAQCKDAYGRDYTTSTGKPATTDSTRVSTADGPGSIHGGIVHLDQKK